MEVNASPSLSTTTEADRIMKLSLLRDIYNIVAAGQGDAALLPLLPAPPLSSLVLCWHSPGGVGELQVSAGLLLLGGRQQRPFQHRCEAAWL